ncbi:hypothetical protein [Microbacterium sp. Se5.02b]|uniref:hypothetical protein n=1 Tax=Microbacterium sp. Se5.02b TaxID=2864103 RepID=UPI001C68A042|nr:hypothetical protein [Microbacterium sp. Se5.02b]QYM63038.1 hypothetical protein K1X59_11935 [Microbacterium sp. Se5.02b]
MNRRVRSIRVPGAVRGITLRLLLVVVVGVGAAVLVPFPLWQGVALLAAVVSVIIPGRSPPGRRPRVSCSA